MAEVKSEELNLSNSVFDETRLSFDCALRNLLNDMQEKRVPDGTLTLKLAVTMTQVEGTTPDGEFYIADMPVFGAEVSTAVTEKSRIKCKSKSNGELVYDRMSCTYKLRKVSDGQMRINEDGEIKDSTD